MRNKLAGGILAALAFVGLVAAPTPAQAAVTDCPVGYFCIWTGYGYTSTRYQWNRSAIDAGTRHGIRLGTFASNHGRSFYNHTTASVNIYDDGACGYNPHHGLGPVPERQRSRLERPRVVHSDRRVRSQLLTKHHQRYRPQEGHTR